MVLLKLSVLPTYSLVGTGIENKRKKMKQGKVSERTEGRGLRQRESEAAC